MRDVGGGRTKGAVGYRGGSCSVMSTALFVDIADTVLGCCQLGACHVLDLLPRI